MSVLTNAQLALELGVPKPVLRDFLRTVGTPGADLYVNGPIDDRYAAQAREHFGPRVGRNDVWTLEPGDTVRRRELHAVFGGQQQQGISTPVQGENIFIFTDPVKGAKYGYDQFEGLNEDGTYSYTGEGTVGDQQYLRGNRALGESAKNGKIIRLFRTKDVNATYIGAFTTASPPFQLVTIPDVGGNPRQAFLFHLVPVDARPELLPQRTEPDGETVDSASESAWHAPDASDVEVSAGSFMDAETRVALRLEFQLQRDFGNWLTARGTTPKRLRLESGGAVLEPDMYVRDPGWVVEAKKSPARGYVRTAIGQVLDYAHVARKHGYDVRPLMLLPSRPVDDLVDLSRNLDITIAHRNGSSFAYIDT